MELNTEPIQYATLLNADGMFEMVPITDPRVVKEKQLRDELDDYKKRIEKLEKIVVAMQRNISYLDGAVTPDRRA